IDIDGGGSVAFRGEVITVPTRGPGGSYPPDPIPLRIKWLHVDCSDGYCWEHDPGGYSAVATYTNVAPPFAWYIDGNPVPWEDGDILVGGYIWGGWNGFGDWAGIRCVATNGLNHTNILVEGWAYATAGHCPPSTTNIIGAAWTSTHNPTNATDHLPEVKTESITQYGPNCPPTTNLLVKAGWTHNTSMLWIRNLVRIITHDPWDDETDHCIGLIWSAGGSVSLYDYLADCCKPFADKFSYAVNGSPCSGTLGYGPEPNEFHPTVFHVELQRKEDGEVLDRMWVVMNATQAKNEFNNWYGRNADTSWVNTLPKPYAKLQISSSWLWGESATPVNPSNPDPWNSPSKLSGYLHHDSAWEMRSKADAEGHGNQACYDANGDIVLGGIGGGTADYFSGTIDTVFSHVREDVNPYLNALHLDGNPGDTGWANGISRPCLYQGDYLDKYIERRPIIQPEGEQP
ncbi:MAG: hypothetical protein IJT64_02490, partial [Kiritimatiellae bacterium]|nr:hypothetical protein [Kiritimatiellia bacterium]